MSIAARIRTRATVVAITTIFCWLAAGPTARADVVTDWNIKAGDIVADSHLPAPPCNRVLAIVQTAVYEAVDSITRRYPSARAQVAAEAGASVEAAVAAANYATLVRLVPAQEAATDTAYREALAKIADGSAKTAGIEAGKQAAAAVLASRAHDGADDGETYRPYVSAGVYVPTAIPLVTQWPHRHPWLMSSPSQFRPGPPPALTSETWARDYNEIKAVGSRQSTRRTPGQTAIARFWEATLPAIYHGVVRSVATQPGREVTRNARLFMAVTQAADDALIAVMDAKYYYNFWRPITAIRNGDIDGNDATERDPSWTPFIETPMHPEYPCAHCIVAAAVGTVLQAEIGAGSTPTLTTTSVTDHGASRSWKTPDEFVREVAEARICDGVHFRHSTEVGTAMGRQVGALAVAAYLQPSQ